MKTWKVILPLAVVLLLAGQALAQADEEERMRAAETREAEMEQRLREAENAWKKRRGKSPRLQAIVCRRWWRWSGAS